MQGSGVERVPKKFFNEGAIVESNRVMVYLIRRA
jgi:hypothetical protein